MKQKPIKELDLDPIIKEPNANWGKIIGRCMFTIQDKLNEVIKELNKLKK